MDWGKIREIVLKRKLGKTLLLAFVVVVVFFYFKAFFTTGIHYDDEFLKKEVVDSETHYKADSVFGTFHITVRGQKDESSAADVIYRLPNNINAQYKVNFKDPSNWDSGIENIMDDKGNVVFEGEYIKDSPFLYDKNGKPILDGAARVTVNGRTVYDEDYKISLKNVADLATFSDETIRGRWEFLIPAVILFIVVGIDMKFPLFFFNLKYWLAVENPEPSEFYIAMQKLSWVVIPIIGTILLLIGIA